MPRASSILSLFLLAPLGLAQSVQLQPPLVLPAGVNPLGTALADVDGDGELDLVLALDGPPRLLVLRNQGGLFAQGPSALLPTPQDAFRPVAADLDGDGDVDLAVSSLGSDEVIVVENDFPALTAVATFPVDPQPGEVVAGDLDGDGDVDLAVASAQTGLVSLLTNQGGFAFAVQGLAAGTHTTGLAAADLDSDGALDLACVDGPGKTLHVWLQQGGQLVAQPPLSLAGSIQYADLEAGDLDGDGDEDLIATGTTTGINVLGVRVIYALGGGQLSAGPLQLLKPGGGGTAELTDLDADGLLDLSISNVLGFQAWIYVNLGGGDFTGQLPTVLQLAFGAFDLDAADVDGNGVADLVVCDGGADEVRLYMNVQAGTPCAVQTYCTAKPSSLGQLPGIAPSGVPSRGAQGFGLTLTSAVPHSVAIAIESAAGPAAVPFQSGFLCVQTPITRLPPRVTSTAGVAAVWLDVPTALVGSTRWYQWWCRDPAHPDGTGVGLSDGLAVTYCP